MRDRDLRPYTNLAREWMEKTYHLPPTQAALQIASELLAEASEHNAHHDPETASWVKAAILGGLDAEELIARVVGALWVIHDHPDGHLYSKSLQQENVAVARWALRPASRYGKQRCPAMVSRRFGDLCRRGLARYALALLEHKRETEAARKALVEQSACFG